MDVARLALFDLAERRLAWVGQRQEVLAQNIANADTPGWRGRDLKPFAALLAGRGAMEPARTDAGHLPATPRGARPDVLRGGERAPDGNAVVLDVELRKVADTESTHALVTGLYSKYLAMFRTAAGR